MHESHDFLRNIAVVLGVAALTTVVCERLRLPVVFGYMLAGLIIGPHVPIPIVADPDMVHTLSELGVILLMFSLGLEFNLRRLVSTGWGVVIVAVLQSSFMGWLGFEAGRILGWSPLASLYTGAAIAISSTTIVVKALQDRRARGAFTDLVFGVLIVEDLIAILLLAMLTPAGGSGAGSAATIGWAFLRLFAVLAGILVVGLFVVPRFVRFVVGLRRSEITLVVSVGLCFSIALLVRSFGYSVALGAFLAGALVAESGEEKRIEHLVEPVRAMFGAIFFVSVGMMIVPDTVVKHWGAVASLTLLVIVGKIGAVSVASFLTGTGIRTAVQAGMSLAQIGEFSFIIAAAGIASGATPAPLYPIVVAISALTTLSTPWLIRFADPVAAWVDKSLPRPLQTFAALYGTWIESAREKPATSEDRRRIGRAIRALALDAAAIVVLCVGVSIAMQPLVRIVVERTPLQPPVARGLVVGAALALSVPFLSGIVRTGRVLGDALSRRAFPEPQPGRLDLAAAPRRALIVAIQFATVVMIGAPLVAVTQPFLPAFMGVVMLLVMIAAVGAHVWRNAADLQGHVHAAAEAIVSAIGHHNRAAGPGGAEQVLQKAYQLLPGLGEPVPVGIGASSPFAGRTLSEIALRGRTGATIIAISRGEDVVLVPNGHEVLQAGDVLALAGTSAAVEAARLLLERGEDAGPTESESGSR
ncbi:MAG TPA: cation:proton antiporter [Methylomirabilota bacterium]|nr:cation:proton antiporter [Methylomirabilota bacterium]